MASMDVCCNDLQLVPWSSFQNCVVGMDRSASFSAAAELECHHRGQLLKAAPILCLSLSLSVLCLNPRHWTNANLTTTDTDGEQKHRTGNGREPPTGVRKQEDSTHTVQERILPDNNINSFIYLFFYLFYLTLLPFFYFFCFYFSFSACYVRI